jgi:hypothetical protein
VTLVSFVCCLCLASAHAKKVPLRNVPPAAEAAFHDLVAQTGDNAHAPGVWRLLVTDRPQLDAHTDTKGTIWVEGRLADLLGNDRGLWAAVLAHEMAHNLHKRNALVGLFPILGGRALRNDESAADVGGMLLMARAGYHPVFMLSIQQTLRLMLGEHSHLVTLLLYDHPRWATREDRLKEHLDEAQDEFATHWTDPAQSPGGPPPQVALLHSLAADAEGVTVAADCFGTTDGFQIKADTASAPGSCGAPVRIALASATHRPINVSLIGANGKQLDTARITPRLKKNGAAPKS